MAGVGAPTQNLLLNWSLNTAAATRPTVWTVGLSLGSPTAAAGSELAMGSGITRQTLTMSSSATGTFTNVGAMTFGPSSGGTFTGLQVWDTAATLAGNMLYYGTLATPRTLGAGDSLVFAVGALVISMQ